MFISDVTSPRPVYYHKTSASSNIVVGVFNTGDRISSSAELGDLIGRREEMDISSL